LPARYDGSSVLNNEFLIGLRMPKSGLVYRQQQLAQIAAAMFTDPVSARAQCLNLLGEARHAFDALCFIDAALLLSQIEDQLGDLNSAIAQLSEAMVFAEEFKQTQRLPEILEQIGRCYYTQACYPQALEHWQQCAVLCGKNSALLKTRSLALMGLGQICDAGGDNALAVQMHASAHQLLADVDDAFLLVKAKINWAVNLHKMGERRAAKELLRQSLSLCLQHQLPHYAATSSYRLAEIELADGHLLAAECLIEDGLHIVASTPYHWVEVNLLSLWAQLLAQQSAPQAALEKVQRGLLIAQDNGFRHQEMRLAELAERYARNLGQIELADDYAHKVNFMVLHLNALAAPQLNPNLSGLSFLIV
jgi:tetratricopeptide (TPR) repeat protein